MGRIKTQLVKRTTNELMRDYGSEFTDDFKKNKEILAKHMSFSSKKIRNTIAGYLTRLVKKGRETTKKPFSAEPDSDVL